MAKITVGGTKAKSILTIEIDLSQERKPSSSGKSMLVEAFTKIVEVGDESIKVGLNIYVPNKKK